MKHEDQAVFAEAVHHVERWARSDAGFNPLIAPRVYPVCLSVEFAMPSADVPTLVTLAKVMLWIFAIDDVIDEGDPHQDGVWSLADRYGPVARGISPPRVDDPLAGLLLDVCDGLARFPRFESLRPIWARQLSKMVDAMAMEHQWRQEYREFGFLPASDEYLDNGCSSIGVPVLSWAIIAAIDEPMTTRHVGRLARQVRQAAMSVRLANDLRSYLKEVAEGNINSIVLRAANNREDDLIPAELLDVLRAQVERDISHSLAVCRSNAERAHPDTRNAEEALERFARWVCTFYRRNAFTGYRPGMDDGHGWTSTIS